jgi:molybdate transport system substrate-binding protein
MMIKHFFLSLILLSSLYASDIRLAVAANVSYAIEALITNFQLQHPSINIDYTLASSGKLTAQIIQNAPYDIFLSANMDYPHYLQEKGLTLQNPKLYAQGSLILLSAKKRDFSKNIAILNTPQVGRIAIANPKTAPYGKAAQEMLQNAHLYTQLKTKFIYGESIGQTLIFTLKAADVGIIAKSLLYAPKLKYLRDKQHFCDIDPKLYTPIDQGVALLKHAHNNQSAQLFYNYLFSKEAQEILQSYGYLIP